MKPDVPRFFKPPAKKVIEEKLILHHSSTDDSNSPKIKESDKNSK